jgi:uncharacterized protein YbjT (DUF2867 family)
MILVTSANGKTGQHVVRALLAKKQEIRALDISEKVAELQRLGVKEVIAGDMLDAATLNKAMDGVRAVVHIGPPFHPRERMMGEVVIDAAKSHGVGLFVYFSVLHPQIEALIQHTMKLKVEEHLINSRLPYTILQPMHYMQNVFVGDVVRGGVFDLPYSMETPLSFVDMQDVAEVAGKVLTEAGHERATYELCGSDTLSGFDIARIIGEESGTRIETKSIPLQEFISHVPVKMSDYTVHGIERLFTYYNRHGLTGNPNVLAWLLGRKPTTFAEYVRRELKDPSVPRNAFELHAPVKK